MMPEAPSVSGRPQPLRVCLIDMNNGVPNQAIRCFGLLLDDFVARVHSQNPELEASIVRIQPRNLGDTPPADCDLYVASGGPGSPFDGYDDAWCQAFRHLLDDLHAEGERSGDAARAALLVCHSWEIAVEHFGIARMAPRTPAKFGVMPVYM